MIEPEELDIADVPGLALEEIRSAAGFGLRVILGRNNAGKTRLLRAIASSSFAAVVDPKKTTLPRMLESRAPAIRQSWPELPVPLRVVWTRDISDGEAAERETGDTEKVKIDSASIAAVERSGIGHNADLWRLVRIGLITQVRRRPAMLVPTQRYGGQDHPMSVNVGLDLPVQWAAVLADLANSRERWQRDIFKKLDGVFEDITEGLHLRPRQSGGTATVQIEDFREIERNLSECGDGLRDLMGIALYAAQFPEHDLLLDEPGLRLHPHAQRRLLRYLEEEAKNRAVWIASHDGVFVGAPSVQGCFHVQRDREKDSASVKALGSRESRREAMGELGWVAGDALLADCVLLCEGPSDRIAFERVVSWVADSDAAAGGTVVCELGGDGEVWAKDLKAMKSRMGLVQRVAPYARHVALLDKATQPQAEVQRVEKELTELGSAVYWLPRVELENYWLAPNVVRAIVQDSVNDALESGRKVEGPSDEAIRAVLDAHKADSEKGSDILREVCKLVPLRFNKVRAAQVAIELIKDQGPDQAEELQKAVRDAIGGARISGEAAVSSNAP